MCVWRCCYLATAVAHGPVVISNAIRIKLCIHCFYWLELDGLCVRGMCLALWSGERYMIYYKYIKTTQLIRSEFNFSFEKQWSQKQVKGEILNVKNSINSTGISNRNPVVSS